MLSGAQTVNPRGPFTPAGESYFDHPLEALDGNAAAAAGDSYGVSRQFSFWHSMSPGGVRAFSANGPSRGSSDNHYDHTSVFKELIENRFGLDKYNRMRLHEQQDWLLRSIEWLLGLRDFSLNYYALLQKTGMIIPLEGFYVALTGGRVNPYRPYFTEPRERKWDASDVYDNVAIYAVLRSLPVRWLSRDGSGLPGLYTMADAIGYASQLHNQWRATRQIVEGGVAADGQPMREPRWKSVSKDDPAFKKAPEEFRRTRIESEKEVYEVDIANLDFSRLPEKFRFENEEAALGVMLITGAGRSSGVVYLEEAAAKVHEQWLARNESWAPPEQNRPYAELSEEEKDKDRAIVKGAVDYFNEHSSWRWYGKISLAGTRSGGTPSFGSAMTALPIAVALTLLGANEASAITAANVDAITAASSGDIVNIEEEVLEAEDGSAEFEPLVDPYEAVWGAMPGSGAVELGIAVPQK